MKNWPLLCIVLSGFLLAVNRDDQDYEYLSPNLINGKPVEAGTYKEVVSIASESDNGSAHCSATIVGPKVVVTAAHCGKTGGKSTFTLDGVEYTGKIERSDIYPGQDHDISIIILDNEVPMSAIGAYASIGGKAEKGFEKYLKEAA